MSRPLRGVSLIDVIVGTFLVLVVFMTLFGLLRASILVSAVAKARASATSLATSQLEYVRSLSYDSVGTIGGIPPGIVPQYATTTLDNFTFVTRTFIGYVDDPADGEGAGDLTGITTDYKQVKVTVSYFLNNKDREVSLVSNIVPPGLETSTGGGTLKIDVVTAAGAPLAGASVHITNDSLNPSVDVTTFSNAVGVVYLPGAATSSEYQVSVTKSGYSTAATYARDATNQNPTPGYLTVAKDQTTTGTFAIDVLAELVLRTFSPMERATTTDSFADASLIASQSGTDASAGSLTLSGGVGTYPANGNARSTAIAPGYLAAWHQLDADLSTPVGTEARVQVVDGLGTPLPNEVLPGNGSGFSSFPVSLTGISTTTYPSLALVANLSTNSSSTTPAILSWSVSYDEGPVPLPDVPFTLQGAKTIGSTGAGAAIYKTNVSDTTGAEGTAELSLEWDVYSFVATGYDVVEACTAPPFTLAPGSASDVRLMLDDATSHMALVTVRDAGGTPVTGASVTLSRTGYSETVTTGGCGTAYFGGLTSGTDYTVLLQKSGYTDVSYTNVPISGKTYYVASFE